MLQLEMVSLFTTGDEASLRRRSDGLQAGQGMAEIVDTDPFDTSAALAILDGMARRSESAVLATVAPAWEAAWIACLTNSPAWAVTAALEFASVVSELRSVICIADQRMIAYGSGS